MAVSKKERFKAFVRYYVTTLPAFPHHRRKSQVVVRFHPSEWFLFPFATNPDVPGLWQVTWLMFTIRLTW